MKPIFAILPALLLAPAVLAGSVYKWTDEKGRVHYSDKPVPSAKKIEIKPLATDTVSKVAAERDGECAQKKKQLETYLSAQAVMTDDGHGKQRALTTEEYNGLIDRTKKSVDAACAPKPPEPEIAPEPEPEEVPAEPSEPAARGEPLPEGEGGQ